ncbi:MAG: potassium/proton antiporter [Lachnospirales bacterium]
MNFLLLLTASAIFACIAGSRLSRRLGIPTLFIFIALGMLFGSDGIFKIEFADYHLAEQICSAALVIIMFYGGFGTKWSAARPVAVQSVLLSTLGVLITAGLTGFFCYFFLNLPLLEGLLIGAVLGSTDAASVFSILRSQRLNLKYGTASMLEIESGSNDPFAYMLTIVVLSAMGGSVSLSQIVWSVFSQIFIGLAAGSLLAWVAGSIMKRVHFGENGLDSVFLSGVALASYAIPSLLGGNGYLSAYLAGILLGNQSIPNKKGLVNFFDALNGMMQMLIFFLLGLLVFPSRLGTYFLPALLTALFLTFFARPAAVFLLLAPFKAPFRQKVLISWAGLRGAASIVFAIMAAVSPYYGRETVFHIVFCVVLLSILLQGSLLPLAASKTHMLDSKENVLKTFTDYSEETGVQFICLEISPGHPWINCQIQDVSIAPDILIAAVLRDQKAIMPRGDTCLKAGDSLIVAAKGYHGTADVELSEVEVTHGSRLAGMKLKEADIRKNSLVVLIQRQHHELIPDGDTILCPDDILVLYTCPSFSEKGA